MFEIVPVLIIILSVFLLLPYLLFFGRDAPFVPMEAEVVERVMEIAKVKRGDVFYDLGSGDGRLVIAAALRGAKAVGIEINFWRAWYSRVLILLFGLSGRAKIIKKDLFGVDLRPATVVSLYLLQVTNEKLQEKLRKDLSSRSRIVSVAFSLPEFVLVKEDKRGTRYGPIRLYSKKG